MALSAVLFDFSGTLFRFEEEQAWFNGITDAKGEPVDAATQSEVLRTMTAPSRGVESLGPEYQHAWENRDLDPEQHRKVMLAVLHKAGVKAEHADAIYARLIDPDCWTPYPDTKTVISNLHAEGIKVAVISNIAFDIRPAFERVGVADMVDEFLLSYLEGLIKPEPKLFLRACERLGVAPGQALMIGDHASADGGAAEVGCQVEIVEPIATADRPDALLTAVAKHA